MQFALELACMPTLEECHLTHVVVSTCTTNMFDRYSCTQSYAGFVVERACALAELLRDASIDGFYSG